MSQDEITIRKETLVVKEACQRYPLLTDDEIFEPAIAIVSDEDIKFIIDKKLDYTKSNYEAYTSKFGNITLSKYKARLLAKLNVSLMN